jgi:hypothetical protein
MAVRDRWPGARAYTEAVQVPRLCFTDSRLKAALIMAGASGLPAAVAGRSAVVFRATTGGDDVALRCFTREAPGRKRRYQELRNYLARSRPSYLMDFSYSDSEILVGDTRYPLVEMRWVTGDPLDAWINRHLQRDGDLTALAAKWLELVLDMERRGIAHGDLDNTNCLVGGDGLTLIDYDGFFLPSLAHLPADEAGHPNFQHPDRPGYNASGMDSFPALVIYLSLLALASDGSLWRYHADRNLICTADDYRAPWVTPVWRDLAANPDPAVRRLTAALAGMCEAPIESLPSLSQVVSRAVPRTRNSAGAELPGSYNAEINRQQPGCLLFLVDQSGSMNDALAGSSVIRKADGAVDAINQFLMDVVVRCMLNFNEGPRYYFDVGVIGYGSNRGAGPCFGGALQGRTLVSVGELAENPLRVEKRSRQISDGAGGMAETTVRFPVWLDPIAEGGAPMREAINLAATVLKSWVDEHPASYPPIVMNITGGEMDTDPVAAAEKLATTRTADGTVLLYNVHLSGSATAPISFPNSSQELPDSAARTLFKMSSIIPRQVARELTYEGHPVLPGARGFVSNGDAVPLITHFDIGTRIAFIDEITSTPIPTSGGDSAVEPGPSAEAIESQRVQVNKFIDTYVEQQVVGTRQDQSKVRADLKVFVSYSHKDERYRERLEISLAQLRRDKVISTWHDKKILPGKEWDREIDENLNSANLVLLLVSPDFLASDFAYSREMEQALERHESGSAIVVPIILRPCDWRNSRLEPLQALPSRGRAISSWPNRDAAWLDVVQELRRLIFS